MNKAKSSNSRHPQSPAKPLSREESDYQARAGEGESAPVRPDAIAGDKRGVLRSPGPTLDTSAPDSDPRRTQARPNANQKNVRDETIYDKQPGAMNQQLEADVATSNADNAKVRLDNADDSSKRSKNRQ